MESLLIYVRHSDLGFVNTGVIMKQLGISDCETVERLSRADSITLEMTVFI